MIEKKLGWDRIDVKRKFSFMDGFIIIFFLLNFEYLCLFKVSLSYLGFKINK